MDTTKKVIDLEPTGCVLILVEHPTGIIYNAQAGGYACNHPEAEGYIDFTYLDVEKLDKYFVNEGKYNGWCSDGIDKEDADFLDSLLVYGWKVDRTRLKEAMEAWIPIIKEDAKGYLVWENSD